MKPNVIIIKEPKSENNMMAYRIQVKTAVNKELHQASIALDIAWNAPKDLVTHYGQDQYFFNDKLVLEVRYGVVQLSISTSETWIVKHYLDLVDEAKR